MNGIKTGQYAVGPSQEQIPPCPLPAFRLQKGFSFLSLPQVPKSKFN